MEIVKYPDPVLRRRAEEVAVIDEDLRARVQEMFRTLYEARGLGLAAPQVGWGVRLFVVGMTGQPAGERVFVNPEVVEAEGEEEDEEGCLSFPDIRARILRASRVKVVATGLDGRDFEVEATGYEARCYQHEMDHLDGILFTTRMPPAERSRHGARIKTMEEEYRERVRVRGSAQPA
ncbi:MAG: peptide deformylase [Planctomycetes bacterium]|nr:peptide deformylase [Planctomycetota bacterium]